MSIDEARARLQFPQAALILLAMLSLSFLFYGRALNNPLWHGEDFNFLAEAQRIAEDPPRLFEFDAGERHHPVPLSIFAVLYKAFGFEPTGYYAVNLAIHGLNAFLVYALVMAFVPDRRIAGLSGLLFVLGVGSYGKAVLFIGGFENLFITLLYLSILNLYVRNDLWNDGRVLSWSFALVVVLFLIASYAKPTSFSLVAGLLAYKVFFRKERERRPLLAPNLVLLVTAAFAFWLVREMAGVVDFSHALAGENPWEFAARFVRNFVNYLVHMFFPIHVSRLVETSNPVIQLIYDAAPVLRVVIGLFAVSYSLFGFVFGNRTIRFFLSWTFISLLPYCVIQFPADWLNIRYLYQVSIGFCFILASGTVLSMDLLHRRRWRRFLPYVVPAAFVLLSSFIAASLDSKYERDGQSEAALQNRADLEAGRM